MAGHSITSAGLLFLFLLIFSTQSSIAGRGLALLDEKDDDSFQYNHTFAQILVEYSSVVYVNDLDSLIAWNCTRCHGFITGFKLVELIVDVQHCLQAIVGVDEDVNAIVITFRGTQETSIQNWMEDLYFRQLDLNYPGVRGAMVHRGFYTAYHNTTLRPRIMSAVKSIQEEIDGLDIYVTGHSMGGAMAAFCSLDLVANYGMRGVKTVTFGQPRIGNNVFAAYYSSFVPCTYRMTHAHDVVPHLPPYYSLFPQRSYHHFGREVWIHSVDAGGMSYEVESVCDDTGEDPSCSRSVSGNSISDHLCYMGIFLQADIKPTCSFILKSNVTETSASGFVIKSPFALKSLVDRLDSKGVQVM